MNASKMVGAPLLIQTPNLSTSLLVHDHLAFSHWLIAMLQNRGHIITQQGSLVFRIRSPKQVGDIFVLEWLADARSIEAHRRSLDDHLPSQNGAFFDEDLYVFVF